MINNWLDSTNIILLIIFLAEILLARRIYRKTRRKSQEPQKEIIFVFHDLDAKTKFMQSHHGKNNHSKLFSHINEFHLPRPLAKPRNSTWTTISLAMCTIAVFFISFIILNWIQNPVLYLWSLRLLTVLVPIPFLTFPTLFQLRSFSTFSLLFIGLGMGLIFSILV
ncbi:MAG: hypothetical protein Q6361_09160 [Candidatus Hermodarchaeota archaeon]|nr:hypothetical protein [Candidatus Hermodarchaeota archaeon]